MAARPCARALAVAPCSSSPPSPSTSASSSAAAPTAGGGRRGMLALGVGLLASAALLCPAGDAGATRIEYFATVGEKLCDMDFAKSGLGYCDVAVGTGVLPKRFDLINYCFLLRWISVHRRWISYALTCCFRRHPQPSAAVEASGLIARLDLDDPFSVRRAELIDGIALIQFAEPIFCEES